MDLSGIRRHHLAPGDTDPSTGPTRPARPRRRPPASPRHLTVSRVDGRHVASHRPHAAAGSHSVKAATSSAPPPRRLPARLCRPADQAADSLRRRLCRDAGVVSSLRGPRPLTTWVPRLLRWLRMEAHGHRPRTGPVGEGRNEAETHRSSVGELVVRHAPAWPPRATACKPQGLAPRPPHRSRSGCRPGSPSPIACQPLPKEPR